MQILSSDSFFYFIIGLAVLQAIWFVFSVKLAFFDEPQHFGFISQYAHRLNPFIGNQPPSWDFLGSVTRDPSYLFYYLMSFPMRLITLITQNFVAQVIVLRLIMVTFFVSGLVIYKKVFSQTGAPRTVSNLTLLTIVLIPNIITLAGAINYDNVIFLLFAITLLWAIRLIQAKQTSFGGVSKIIIIGLLSSLIKFTFLVLFLPLFCYVLFDAWKKHGSKLPAVLASTYRQLSNTGKVILIAGLIVSTGLFIERPVANIAIYHKISPSCQRMLGEDRCQINPVTHRNLQLLHDKPAGFLPYNPVDYASVFWIPSMITTLLRIDSPHAPLPILEILTVLFVCSGVALILVNWRFLMRRKEYQLMLLIIIVYTAVLFWTNYTTYVHYAVPLAMNGRYLLPVIPLFSFLSILSLKKSLDGRYAKTSLVTGFAVAVLLTQGGGIITPILRIDNDAFYWQNRMALRASQRLRVAIHPVVFERYPYKIF